MKEQEQLKGKSLLLVGFTLFSMFFGAGNLIFPPFLAAQAGVNTWGAMVGFSVSAVGLPILGVIAVARCGGLDKLGGRVHPKFAAVFTLLIYLSIGPCLAIPRTASTSFEMAVTPFLTQKPGWVLPFLYSLVFFAVALALALRPEKLSGRLGKILCPALLLLIAVMFVGCLIRPVGGYSSQPAALYLHAPAVQGFLDGYQTMDTIAALNFGLVIALNIRALGISEEKAVVRGTVRAGWLAGVVLLLVYTMLAHIGALSGGAFPGAANGAETLTHLVSALFGPMGSILLAAIFVIACLNTCTGLISCCSTYFTGLFPSFGYRAWAIFFAVVSMVISNAGLNQILAISIPVLSVLYPVAIVLIVLSFLHRWIAHLPLVYPVCILLTGIASVAYALAQVLGITTGPLFAIPLAAAGLGWILPALIGGGLGAALSLLRPHSDRS